MSLSAALKLYLCINALLLIGYSIFFALRTITKRRGTLIGYRQWIHTAQIIIGAAIIAPLLFQLVPAKSLPRVEWGVFQTLIENPVKEARVLTRNFGPKSKTATMPVTKAPDTNSVSNWFVVQVSSHRGESLGLILLIGFLALLGRLGLNWFRLHQLANQSIVIRRLSDLRIGLSEAVSVPLSVRLWKHSWVLLPTSVLSNNRDFQIAIKHELQHHRQGETRWALFIELLTCVFFPNPVIYKWKRDIVELQEFSCDEALIGQRGVSSHEYGRCLLRVAEAALGNCQMYVGTTCMATISKNPKYSKSFLRRRIEMFTSHERPRFTSKAGALIGTCAFLLTVSLAYGAQQSLRDNPSSRINPGELVVDDAIQAITERVLHDAILMQNAKGGFAIVAEPSTGRILAAVDIDNTDTFPENWALNQRLEPASLFKALVAAQAIESGLTSPQETHLCEHGVYKFGKRVYHDWKKNGWDHLTTEETVTNSSDLCTMKIAEKIGAEGLRQMLVNFGFGPNGTAKFFPRARVGTLPPEDDVNDPKMVPFVSAGFGFKTTPLEVVQAYGAIANGGNLLAPQTADTANAQPKVIRRVLSSETSDKVKEILRQVVLKGTGKLGARSHLYSTAGKTASSYIPDLTKWDLVEGRKRANFAGFIGFAPVDEPRIEVYVGIHDPASRDGAHGSAHAAPVFRRIIEDVLTQMKVVPDKK